MLGFRIEKIQKDIKALDNKSIITSDEDQATIDKLQKELKDISVKIKKLDGAAEEQRRERDSQKVEDYTGYLNSLKRDYEYSTRKLLALKNKMDKSLEPKKSKRTVK